MKVLHAPCWVRQGTALETDSRPSAFVSMCRVSEPDIDLKAQTANCQACISQLRNKSPQWMNMLLAMGWTFAVRERKPRTGRKAGPRQASFADLYGKEQELK